MEDLKVIERELVPVYETSAGEKVVCGTELYAVLGVKSKFADWIKNRLNDCEAIEEEDYSSFSKILEKGGRPQMEYVIKLDTAKEMAMLERNEKGKQVRKYFIQVEKKYKAGIVISTHKESEVEKRLRTMEMNARSRMAQTYLKLAEIDTLSPTYKSVLAAKASEVLAGEPLLPLPKVERKAYSAKEIGDMFGISANKVGRIANEHKLKTAEYGEYRRDKSRHSVKEVDTWVYYDTVIPRFEEILGRTVA